MIFIKILFFLFPIFSQPTIDWFVEYNGSGEESHGHFILKCNDGGFIQVGEQILPVQNFMLLKQMQVDSFYGNEKLILAIII